MTKATNRNRLSSLCGLVLATPLVLVSVPAVCQTSSNDPVKAEDTPVEQEAVAEGPLVLSPLSALYTEQRPFLLNSQDASITYLMPSAVMGHHDLGRSLREVLEARALDFWLDARKSAVEKAAKQVGPTEANETSPRYVLSSRVENRLQSPEFSSLFLQEVRSIKDAKDQKLALTFNFDQLTRKPFGFSDMFQAEEEKDLQVIVDLIAAYIRVDIARQKSIRLGAEIAPDQDAWLNNFAPKAQDLGIFTLEPSKETGKIAGLTFHFNPGVLGAEADGAYQSFVPASIFLANLKPRFAAHFGGDALKVNNHSAEGFSTAVVHLERIKDGAELGGLMLIEGEVPKNWCDGFSIGLVDNGTVVSSGSVTLLPDAPSFGVSEGMLRFRAELEVSGEGGKAADLFFSPLPLSIKGGRLALRPDSACKKDVPVAQPDLRRDSVSIPVRY